ncbi:MAG: ISKra4 family transposase, partial [Acidobacteriaceae bacterium]|nr:ISKra4 family transposase [Acidobacteriaceae bacterium]
NRAYIPNHGELYRCGETITTSFVESTVNQVVSKRLVKKQAMQWSPRGAHLLLQTRTKVLNEELEDTFRQWYPAFRPMPLSEAA